MKLSDICTPALIYFILSILTTAIGLFYQISLVALIIKIVWVILWTWFLNFLCSKGYSGISWFLVLLPIIFGFLMVFLAVDVIANTAANAPSANK